MKKLMVLLVCFLSLTACGSCKSNDTLNKGPETAIEAPQYKEIKWIDATEIGAKELIEKSAVEDKVILMFFHTKYCGYCKKMAEETFKDQEVINMVSENFIPVFVDVDEHPDMADGFGIEAYPTYWFGRARMDANGEVDQENSSKAKISGYYPPEDYMKILQIAIDTL